MNILVIGSGVREHAIAKQFNNAPSVQKVFVAPGNDGMKNDAEIVAIDALDFEKLADFAKTNNVALTFVGPEQPLAAGIVDYFNEQGLVIFGPTKAAAQIEGSKSYAKEIMNKYGIPTADHETFTEADKAVAYIKEQGAPIVIKADGLAAGKGVIVAMTEEEAIEAVEDMIGAGLDDLGKGHRSQVGTIYSTNLKGPRYLDLTEGYITDIGLDENNQIIGYKFVNLGKMMENIKKGIKPMEAIEKASGKYGRFDEAVKKIDPRQE